MILSKLLTSELATSLNWMGKGHKRGMHSSQLAKAVIDAAKKSGIKEAKALALQRLSVVGRQKQVISPTLVLELSCYLGCIFSLESRQMYLRVFVVS
ncbi:unnamed protein product [Clavelina lepadiformis]|uniref:Uncharacterized protein n=1 Tax=Clavelina lepadiformis TaxID=159417 RepID=A0ABP0FTP3_CLALP